MLTLVIHKARKCNGESFFSVSLCPMFDNNNSDLNNVRKSIQLKGESKVCLARQCWMTSGHAAPYPLSVRHGADAASPTAQATLRAKPMHLGPPSPC